MSARYIRAAGHTFAVLALVSVQPDPVSPGLAARLSPREAVAIAMQNSINADFRISDMGPDGDIDYDAQEAAVAFNSTANEYLVVWAADDDSLGVIDGEFEIFAQRIDAATGAEVGPNDFRVSDMGPDGDSDYDAVSPAVAYNPLNDEYLVVWSGEDNTGALVNGESEIFGQRLAGATGAEIGTNDFRLSDMGPDGDESFDAVSPAVAYNPANNELLVVWAGENGTFHDEFEIYGQRLAGGSGAQIGVNDFRISDMGPANDSTYDAREPAVVYGSIQNEYLVVWQGEDNSGSLVAGEFEVFGQRINAATGLEVGANDFRISDAGPDGDASYDAAQPSAAYSPVQNEYLVVWQGDNDTDKAASGEIEIYGQRINAATGAEIGANDFRISDMGPDGDPDYDARSPAVAYNSSGNEYLVAWEGDDDAADQVNGELEIFVQRLDAATGAEIGANDFRISHMGLDEDAAYDGRSPAVAFSNGTVNTVLVAWDGDQEILDLADDEYEIYGQLLDASSGEETGADDFRISDMGPDGDIDYDAREPAVAYNPVAHEYLVVWEGDDTAGNLVDGETEIFGQRIDAASGAEIGANDFRISDMGPDGDPAFDAVTPAVAYNDIDNEYLVVWSGEDGSVSGEFEIYGQRIDAATGLEIGTNDFRISDMGPNGSDIYDAEQPAVAYHAATNEYLVVWSGDDNTPPLVDGESEIFGQRLTGDGIETGANDFRISDMGPDGDNLFDALSPAVAFNTAANCYLVVWEGEENIGGLINGEFEIFGQRIDGSSGLEIGTNDFRISDMGPDGDALYDAHNPAVASRGPAPEYLIVWEGEDDTGPLVDDEYEIFGQRLDAVTGSEIGGNDIRLSDMGPDGNSTYDAGSPSVAYVEAADEYIVVWAGDDDAGGTVDGEFEVYGQRLLASAGAETGTNDFRISSMGTDGDPFFDAVEPAISGSGDSTGYSVVWSGDNGVDLLANDEYEIYGRIFGGSGPGAACGDTNDDGAVNVGDAVQIINYIFRKGPAPIPLCAGDTNGDGQVNVGDAVHLINYIFRGGPGPVSDCCP